ncbi:hypothetical protein P3X46_034911, partial [Hevea brasiliensis]
GVVSNIVSALVKWLWSVKSNTKKDTDGFDGSKLGIEPYSVELSPSGELLVWIHRINEPPKGLTVDDQGNIYIADTMNMAIRKISDGGITTIAGGKWAHGGGHVDGPSEDAKFSNDIDVVYIVISCSLFFHLGIIKFVLLSSIIYVLFPMIMDIYVTFFVILGIAALAAAAFFGYMLAFLQRSVQALFSSNDDSRACTKKGAPNAPYQGNPKSFRPPLIPNEVELEKPDEGFLGSLGRLVLNTGLTVGEIFGGLFSGFRRKPIHYQFQQQYQYQQVLQHSNAWPMKGSFVIPNEDEPPSIETRTPTPNKTYPCMINDMEKDHQFKQNHSCHRGWDGEHHQQKQQQQQQQMQTQMQMQMQHHHQQQQHHHHRHYTSNPKAYYEKSCETNEIVFGAVQEQDGRREAVVIKAVDFGDPRSNHHNIRPRFNYVGYPHGY